MSRSRALVAEAIGPDLFELRGELPSGWVDLDFEVLGSGDLVRVPRLVLNRSARAGDTIVLSLPQNGRIHSIVHVPETVTDLRIELSATAAVRIGHLRVRELGRLEAAARLAVPLVRKRLREPRTIPIMAAKLMRTLAKGGLTEVANTLFRKKPLLSRLPYWEWVARQATLSDEDRTAIRAAIAAMKQPPVFSVLMPVYDTPEPFLRRAIDSVRSQLYPHWQLCIADDASPAPHVRRTLEEAAASDPRIRVAFRSSNGHISAASNTALELATGDWIALLDHDDELTEHALYTLATETRDTDLVYSDEDKIDEHGRRSEPHFKPDWNPELLLSNNYIAHLCAIRADKVRDAGGFRVGFEGSQDHDLVLRVAKSTTRIRHVPHVLYHWRAIEGSTALSSNAKDYAAEASLRALREHTGLPVERGPVPLTYRVRWPVPDASPLVSLIIPTRDSLSVLKKCIETLTARTEYRPYEILVIDNQSRESATLRYLDDLQQRAVARVIKYDHPFNYSAINNLGVRNVTGAMVGLLNNDLEIIDGRWLGEMVAQAVRPEVGAVGAKLLYPDRSIQHGGIILGIGGVAGHAHKYMACDAPGYFSRAQVTQNLSAVTGACLVIRRDLYLRVGGFDETIAVAFNDVDFCLRVRDAGFRNVWTPAAILVHDESRTRGVENTKSKRDRFRREVETMLARWGDTLRNDPAYNPNLTLEAEDFSLGWPSRAPKPWTISSDS